MNNNYYGSFAGTDIYFSFRHKETYKYFGNWIKEAKERHRVHIRVPQSDIEEWISRWGRFDDAFTEFGLSVFRVSDYLLLYDKCVFHAASIVYKDKAYLFTAKSGTGKTTQLMNWMQLYGNETKIINGDKPILSAENDKLWVFPSPWKGKERIGEDSIYAELGGIIYLEQGKENFVSRLSASDAAIPIMNRFLCTVENEEIIHGICRLEEKILCTVPIWKAINTGDLDSTRMIHDILNKEKNNHDV